MRTKHSFDRSLWVALGIAGVAVSIAACGGGGETGSGGSGGGPTTTSSSSSSTTTSSSTSSTSTSSSSGAMNCTEITAGMFKKADGDGTIIIYSATPTPDQGDANVADDLSLQLYGSEADPAYNGEQTGTFDLSMPDDDNFATCSRCVLVFEDYDPTNGAARTYFQSGGTLTIDAASDAINGKINATITDLTLIEVTIDDQYVSTPVDGGKCLHIASASVMVAPPVVPAEWVCDPTWYGDSGCDCGCGAQDLDCADGALATCEYNDCKYNGGGLPVDGMNGLCSVPAEWTCDPLKFADSDCDCGCGIQDYDCADGAAATCTNNNCIGTDAPIDGQNWLCEATVPAGWTCDAALYGDGTNCNCGCGVADPDCADALVGTCDSCNDTGSCSTTACPGTIDATNNAVCAP